MVMKRNLLFSLIVVMSFFGMNIFADNVSRYELNVGDFTTLRIVNDINVEYVCSPDSAGKAVFYTTPDKASVFMFDNNNKGKVSIQLTTDEALAPKNLPTIRIYSQFLQEAKNDGDSVLYVEKLAAAPKVKFSLSGNGKVVAHDIDGTTVEASIFTGKGVIEVSGKCKEANLRCTGSGTVVADRLEAEKKVSCMLVGTGTIKCNVVNGPISIKGTGTGKVYYRGNPSEIKSMQLGKIKAIPLKD